MITDHQTTLDAKIAARRASKLAAYHRNKHKRGIKTFTPAKPKLCGNPNCGKAFISPNGNRQKYCNRECMARAFGPPPRRGGNCIHCGRAMNLGRRKKDWAGFCSAKCAAKARVKKMTPEEKKALWNQALEGCKRSPKTRKGVENISSRWWRLRSPNNKVYEFKNLTHFIRENQELFDPEDSILRYNGTKCRAAGGIMGLRPTMKKNTPGSWKGWTWYSQTERIKNDGRDLLERQSA